MATTLNRCFTVDFNTLPQASVLILTLELIFALATQEDSNPRKVNLATLEHNLLFEHNEVKKTSTRKNHAFQ